MTLKQPTTQNAMKMGFQLCFWFLRRKATFRLKAEQEYRAWFFVHELFLFIGHGKIRMCSRLFARADGNATSKKYVNFQFSYVIDGFQLNYIKYKFISCKIPSTHYNYHVRIPVYPGSFKRFAARVRFEVNWKSIKTQKHNTIKCLLNYFILMEMAVLPLLFFFVMVLLFWVCCRIHMKV